MIVQLITRLILGGAQRIALETADALRRHGQDAELWCGPASGPEGSLLEEARARGIPLRIVPDLVKPVDPWRDLRARAWLVRALRDARPEIVHTHSSKAGILGRYAARSAGVPRVFHTVHGWGFSPRTPAIARAVFVAAERAAAGRADRLVAVSEQVRDDGLRHGIASPSAYTVIRPGIEMGPFRDLEALRRGRARVRSELGLAPDAIVAGTIARFAPQKNLEMILPLIPRFPDVHWLLVGDGPGRGAFERAARAAGGNGRVHLPGMRTDVAACAAALDLFLLVSLWEGLPLTLLEAGAAGVPIVSADVGGAREILPPSPAGRLFPAGDGAALLAAVGAALAARPEAREAALRHRAHVLEQGSWERMLAEVLDLYALDRPPAAPAGKGNSLLAKERPA
jgi:glycosyltransferase involved in cell wall biosynthesis